MSRDPVPISETLTGLVRSLGPVDRGSKRSDGPSSSAMGGVFGRWEEAVGAAVAEHVQPVKLDGDVLVVEVDDPAWATQIRFLEGTVRERLREVAGAVVERLEVRVARRR